MSSSNLDKGAAGESMAVLFLEKLNYQILHRNYRLSHLEIDIICRDKNCLVFVEVKNSPSGTFGHPAEWIDERKREKLRRAAQAYIEKHDTAGLDIRFDAITIYKGSMEHFINAF
ncbi:MAG: YraN family protein [candidate division Zixibacteria bacterium]|nr:YraN family protein [candidate division Zixibacteria bacterium]